MSKLCIDGFSVDPENLRELQREMDKHGEGYDVYFGVNDLSERVRVFVTHDRLEIRTTQSNGWERTNVYRREGLRTVAFATAPNPEKEKDAAQIG